MTASLTSFPIRLAPLIVPALAVLLAGCGAASKAQDATVPAGVYTSAQDCAANSRGRMDRATCGALIQAAIDSHLEGAPSYVSLRLCEAAEGRDRCERSVSNTFRPRLTAFLITFATPPEALPLYAPKDTKTVGFTTLDMSRTLLAVDEALTLTPSARAIAEGLANGT